MFLVSFGKIRRPASWLIFLVGITGMILTGFKIIATGDAYWGTLGVFFLIANDGFGSVGQIEDEIESHASVD